VRPRHLDDRPGDVDQRLAVHRVRGVEVHELADAVVRAVGHPGDDHPPVAVTDQDHVTKTSCTRTNVAIVGAPALSRPG
jgi:hypothetical protein